MAACGLRVKRCMEPRDITGDQSAVRSCFLIMWSEWHTRHYTKQANFYWHWKHWGWIILWKTNVTLCLTLTVTGGQQAQSVCHLYFESYCRWHSCGAVCAGSYTNAASDKNDEPTVCLQATILRTLVGWAASLSWYKLLSPLLPVTPFIDDTHGDECGHSVLPVTTPVRAAQNTISSYINYLDMDTIRYGVNIVIFDTMWCIASTPIHYLWLTIYL